MKLLSLMLFSLFLFTSCIKMDSSETSHPNKKNLQPIASVDYILDDSGSSNLVDSSSLSMHSSIGIEEGDKNYMLGSIIAAEIIHNKSLAVLDKQFGNIRLFDLDDGRYLKSFSREGRGPGEFISPTDMAIRDHDIYITDRLMKVIHFRNSDSLRYESNIPIDFTPINLCTIDDKLYITGISLKEDKSVHVYDLSSNEYISSFHDTYDSDNALVKMMLSNNKVSCNSVTNTVIVASPYVPFLYGYDTNGELKWLSQFSTFYPIKATEKIAASGQPSITKNIDPDGYTDIYGRVIEMNASEFNYIQIRRSLRENQKLVNSEMLTFRINTETGEGALVSREIPGIYSASKERIIISDYREGYPSINIYQNPFK